MLLTTLALVKRKVGKLPNRRTKLYAEAVSVLLNWNPRIYSAIEEDEAIPQLEYLAYEMCRRGVQRLTEDVVLDLFDKLRTDYRNIRAIGRRKPQEFLNHLEERSGILIKSVASGRRVGPGTARLGISPSDLPGIPRRPRASRRALSDRDKAKSLAEQVAPLAGAVERDKGHSHASWPRRRGGGVRIVAGGAAAPGGRLQGR